MIANDNPFNREVLGDAGLLFLTTKDMGACIGRIDYGATDVAEMRAKAVVRVKQFYTWERITDHYCELISLMESKTRSRSETIQCAPRYSTHPVPAAGAKEFVVLRPEYTHLEKQPQRQRFHFQFQMNREERRNLWLISLAFLLCVILSIVGTWCVRNVANARGWIHEPKSERHIHTIAVPRLGGVAIYFSFMSVVILGMVIPRLLGRGTPLHVRGVAGLLGPALIIFLLGLYDDVYSLSRVGSLRWRRWRRWDCMREGTEYTIWGWCMEGKRWGGRIACR